MEARKPVIVVCKWAGNCVIDYEEQVGDRDAKTRFRLCYMCSRLVPYIHVFGNDGDYLRWRIENEQ